MQTDFIKKYQTVLSYIGNHVAKEKSYAYIVKKKKLFSNVEE